VDYDIERVDETVLALLYLTLHDENEFGARAWKSHDWETLNRLYEKDFISNPKSKAKSVLLTKGGVRTSQRLFRKLFGLSA